MCHSLREGVSLGESLEFQVFRLFLAKRDVSLGSSRRELLVAVRTLYPLVLFRALTCVRPSFTMSCSLNGCLELCSPDFPFNVKFPILIIVGELRLCDLQDLQMLLFEDSLLEGVEGLPTLEEDSLAEAFMLLENICIETTTTMLTFLSWVVLAGCKISRVRIQVFGESSPFVFESLLGSKARP